MYSLSRAMLAVMVRFGCAIDFRLRENCGRKLARVPDFESDDSLLGPIGTVFHPGRTTRVHPLGEILVAVPLAAFENVNLLPEIMDERLGAGAARIHLQHSRDEHPLGIFSK